MSPYGVRARGELQTLAAAPKRVDACALLTGADIQAALGDSVTDKRSRAQPGALVMSQCYFSTRFARSIALAALRRV